MNTERDTLEKREAPEGAQEDSSKTEVKKKSVVIDLPCLSAGGVLKPLRRQE
jgi:hypothetical protein